MAGLRKELKVAAYTYQSSVPHSIKYLLRSITAPINILTRQPQYHPYFFAMTLNCLDPYNLSTTAPDTQRYSTNELLIPTYYSTFPIISQHGLSIQAYILVSIHGQGLGLNLHFQSPEKLPEGLKLRVSPTRGSIISC